MNRYTKSDLERIVMAQLENLNAIHDLLSIMKVQNDLIHKANKKLKEEVMAFKEAQVIYPKAKRKNKTEEVQVIVSHAKKKSSVRKV